MHDQSHSVIRLQCHLEDQQYTTFRDGEPVTSIIDRNTNTQLTEFLTLCQTEEYERTMLP